MDGPEQAPGRKRPRTGPGRGRAEPDWVGLRRAPAKRSRGPSFCGCSSNQEPEVLFAPPPKTGSWLAACLPEPTAFPLTSFCKIIEAAEMSYFCGRDGLWGSAWPCPAALWLQKVPEALYLACSEIHPSFILEGFRILSFSQCPLGQKRESQTIRAKKVPQRSSLEMKNLQPMANLTHDHISCVCAHMCVF